MPSDAEPEFSAAEIASAKRYLESEGYDGAETDPVTYLRALPPLGYPEQARALGEIASRGDFVTDDLHAHDFPVVSRPGQTSRCTVCDVAWEADDDDVDAFEDMLRKMIGPTTIAAALIRRAERDRLDAETLRNILMRHHSGEVEGLTEDEKRTLATVAYRLARTPR